MTIAVNEDDVPPGDLNAAATIMSALIQTDSERTYRLPADRDELQAMLVEAYRLVLSTKTRLVAEFLCEGPEHRNPKSIYGEDQRR